MEDRGRTVTVLAVAAALLAGLLTSSGAQAAPLDELIPGLFGGSLATTINPRTPPEAQQVRVADRFRQLSSALAAARSQVPIPSASGAFRFAWDPEVDTFIRSDQSLGPGLAERAQTLGRQAGTVSTSYTHIDFDTLEGDSLHSLYAVQPAVSLSSLKTNDDRRRFGDDLLVTRLNFGLALEQLVVTAAYGVTGDVDVSLALSINRLRMRATAEAEIDDPKNNGAATFARNQRGVVIGGSGKVCGIDFRCARDGFDDSAVGTGDVFLRSKWHFADLPYADLAAAGVLTVPTGNAADFLGFHDPTFTPWLIASKTFGRVSPHLNLGYAFRSGKDVSQAQWIAGADVLTFTWLTLAADFLGYHDDKRDGINDDVLQSAVGFKLNPFGQAVLAGSVQFPLNRDGLRADVIYTGQVEWTF